MNRSLEQYLRSFTSDKLAKWVERLPLCQYWFNTNYHILTKCTPFEALYGVPPPKILDYIPSTIKVEAVDRQLHSSQKLIAILKHNLVQAQNAMKLQVDQYRLYRVFEVGDWIYLRLQPYKQQSIAHRVLTSCLLSSMVPSRFFRILEFLLTSCSCLLSPEFIQFSMFLVLKRN